MVSRLIFIGPRDAGKTTLAEFLARGRYVHDIPSTLGVEFFRVETVGSRDIRIWDLSGDPRYSQLVSTYVSRTAHDAVCVFHRACGADRDRALAMLSDYRIAGGSAPAVCVVTGAPCLLCRECTPLDKDCGLPTLDLDVSRDSSSRADVLALLADATGTEAKATKATKATEATEATNRGYQTDRCWCITC